MPKRIPRDDLLEALRRLADELGRTPTFDDMDEVGPHSSDTYYLRFDSWVEACEAAGLERPENAYAPDESLLEDLRRLRDELGRRPTTEDVHLRGKYGRTSYYRRFESFKEACEAAGIGYEPLDPWHRKAKELREAVRENDDVPIDVDDTAPAPEVAL